MPPTFSTIKSASTCHVHHHPASKRAPIPAQQHQEKKEACEEKQQAIDDAIGEWYSYTIAKANDLAERFNKKPQYFLDIFFQGGTRMVNHHSKVNVHNTFKSFKAQELHDSNLPWSCIHADTHYHHSWSDGHCMKLTMLQDEYKDEYEALTKEQREELIEDFATQRNEQAKVKWPTPKAQISDVANVVRNMQLLISCHSFISAGSWY
jgi:hypothetical protein